MLSRFENGMKILAILGLVAFQQHLAMCFSKEKKKQMYKINYGSQAIFSNFIYNTDFTHDANISRTESFFKRNSKNVFNVFPMH